MINIYYLDDEPELCEVFTDFFESKSVKITTFTDPKVALEAVKNQPPQMMFLDYRLPYTNGDLVALQMDESIPKYLITGDIFVSTKYKFNKILSKPYKNDEILSIIQTFELTGKALKVG